MLSLGSSKVAPAFHFPPRYLHTSPGSVLQRREIKMDFSQISLRRRE
jgi:hypothetical protein